MDFSNEQARNQHEKSRKKFSESDVNEILDKADDLNQKFKNKGRLQLYWENFKLLFSMINDYYHRRYTEVPWYVISSIGGTLLYVLSPIDLIPDFIPGIGYIDDAAVFAFCLSQVNSEVEKYQEWKQHRPDFLKLSATSLIFRTGFSSLQCEG